MKIDTAKRPRGRPRGPGGLTDALIARQDAMSRRLARQINQILDTFVRRDVVEWEAACLKKLLTFQVMLIVDRDLPIPEFPPPPPPDPTLGHVGAMKPSKSIDEARARGAALRGRLIDLQERCISRRTT